MKTTTVQVILLVAAVWCTYWPALSNGYMWDDCLNIYENETLTRPDALRRIWTTDELYQYYPLTFTSFYLEYLLAGRTFRPELTHAVNIALQTASAIVLMFLCRRLGLRLWAAWLVAALFAIHPLQVESVAWGTERKNLLSGLFFLSSFLFYTRFMGQTRRRDYCLALLLFALAGLSKTVTMTLPASLILLELVRRQTPGQRLAARLAPFAAMSAIFAVLAHHFEQVRAGMMYADMHLSLAQRIIIACRVPWYYLRHTLWPYPRAFVPPRWEIDTTALASYWPVLLTAGAILVLLLLRKRLAALTLFAVGHYLVTLLPASGLVDFIFMLYTFVQDHFQYLACIGALIILAQLVSFAYDRAERIPSRKALVGALVAAVLIALGAVSHRRCYVFHDSETLWRDTLAKEPAAWMPQYNLGVILADTGRVAEALQRYKLSLKYNPHNAKAYNNLGAALARLGQTQRATEAFEQALALEDGYLEARKNLAQVLALAGRLDQAIAQYRSAVTDSPDDPVMQAQLARVLATQAVQLHRANLLQEARRHARRALELDPAQFDALLALGMVLSQTGPPNQARETLHRALDLQPQNHEAHLRLGMLHRQQGDHTRAADAFRQTLRLEPKSVVAANELAFILSNQGDGAGALEVLRESLRHAPEVPSTLLNLAGLLAMSPDDSLRNGPEAIELVERAVAKTGRTTPRSLFVLAAAYAACDRFEDAARTQRRAIDQARAAGQTALADQWGHLLQQYEAQRPYHQVP